MSAQSGPNFETLSDDGEFILSRALRPESGESWLTLVAARVPGDDNRTARLAHALALGPLLDGPWMARPRELVEQSGRVTLILDDPGGVSLARALSGPWETGRFLRVACNLTQALADIHERGLIVRDIKPATLLLTDTDEVALAGFGTATRMTRERQPSEWPEWPASAGASFPYLAPEQTGRMNRSVDARSDLYSLGVVLYQMLTGKLPFQASTLIEWIHCHVAKPPVPAHERVESVLRGVEAVVMNLLAKTAEERYQTARALESDLRRCLDEWQRTAQVEPFPLALNGVSERLRIPDRLYGREADIDVITAAFECVASTGTFSLVLVSGSAGIGKSSVVNALRKALVPANAWFAAGKFDRYRRDIPYATIAQALQGLIRQILCQCEEQVARWRSALTESVGVNGQLMVNLIPELRLLVGPQPPVAELSSTEAQTRFQNLFRRFIGTFAAVSRPLVLFLDDLQWLDAATLELITDLATSGVPHVMIIGAYRDNEVHASHPLARALAAIRQDGGAVRDIVLEALEPKDVTGLLSDALGARRAEVRVLADLVFEKTGGNPFFVVQFLTALVDEKQLAFDPDRRAWTWDIAGIRAKGFSDNIVDLMLAKLTRLPTKTQDALKQFACLGNAAQTPLLVQVTGSAALEVKRVLAPAIDAGLVFVQAGNYAFLHDRVQEAAYAMMPMSERAAVHLKIGRMLAAQVVPDAPGQDIFEVVNQLDRATDLIDDPAERERLAYFNLLAGERAKAANAYVSALSYFAAGCALRGSDTWERDYRLSFALERNLAECEFLTGQTEQAKWRLAELSLRAQTLVDRAAVAWLQVTLFTAQGRSDLAVDLCIGFLRDVGIDWPVHPDRDQARAEYNALLAQIGDRPIHALIDLPLLTDEDRRATLDVLTAVLPPAFFSDEHLVCLVLCRMANLSLLHGNSDASSLAYAYLGMVVGPSFGDYEAGFSFGKLGLALVDERGIDRFKARVYMCFSYHVTPWIRHIRTSLPLLRRAFDAASESGDLTYMGFSSCTLITSLLAAGEPLDIVQREAQERLEVVRAGRFGLIVDIITGQLQMIRCLRGDSTEPGAAFDEAAFERHLESDNGLAIANCWHWIRKLQRSYVNGDTALAMTAISRVAPLLWTSSGHFEMAEYHFYAALARARAHDTASPEQRIELIAELAAHAAQLALWAGHCPANFVSRLSLVAGEMARIRGANFEAMQHYEMAIRASREQGFAQNDALANELAASFYEARGFHATAKIYLRDARHAYLRWGATAKAEELERCHPDLREESSQPNATQAQQIDRLDLAAIVRTSQAISGEVVLAKMIRTLMSVVLEYAGAQRGVLVLPRGEALWIAAEANTAREALNVRIEDREVGPMDLPASMLYYGIRTQQCVRLDDALVSNQFSEDEYVRATQPRSVLCLPLVKQTRLTGVLYLENSLAPGVFTPSRVEALQLLASQAAISLENASLQQTAALLEEKEALLKEVHHRVKNNLQLISSLLSLQAARVRDPEVAELFTDSRNRVRSMALVHENLYRAGNFARIPMASHVEHLCGHLARAYDMHRQNVHLCIEVDDVQLDMSRAISCGLVINELVSNALKHAFPHGRGGSLRVTLKQYGEGACILGVADDGIGLSDGFSVARTGSLGLQLIEDLTQQLLGKLEIRGGENGGTDVTVAFQSCHPRS